MNHELLTKGRSTIVLAVIALSLVLIVGLNSCRIGNVSGEQVGVLIDNWRGYPQGVERRDEAGAVVYNGWLRDFHPLDRSRQELHMTAVSSEGSRHGLDYVKIKTRDGNDLFVDLTIYYSVDPTQAVKVLRESGPGDAYKEKWIRDYSRANCRYVFGELTSEEFYVASIRERKRDRCILKLNEHLAPHGITVESLNVQDFKYLPEYEARIAAKKQADQQVERFGSEYNEKVAEKSKLVDQEKRALENDLVQYRGHLDQNQIQAEGQAARVKEDAKAEAAKLLEGNQADVARLLQEAEGRAAQILAEARARKVRIEQETEAQTSEILTRAESRRASLLSEAIGLLATARAEADGRLVQVRALEGEGGRRLVLAEYAAKLGLVKITGKPVQVEGQLKRLEHRDAHGDREKGGAER